MSAYLPSHLLGYLAEESPFPYSEPEYQVLLGYIRQIRQIIRELEGVVSKLVPKPSNMGDLIPSPIPGVTNIGVPSNYVSARRYWDLYGDGYEHPTVHDMILMMLAYLCSYDTFDWESTLDKLDIKYKARESMPARVAASLGNSSLMLRILTTLCGEGFHRTRYCVRMTLAASPDVSFFLRLRQEIEGTILDSAWETAPGPWRDAATIEIMLRDRVEMLGYFHNVKDPSLLGGARAYGARKIVAYLESLP